LEKRSLCTDICIQQIYPNLEFYNEDPFFTKLKYIQLKVDNNLSGCQFNAIFAEEMDLFVISSLFDDIKSHIHLSIV